MKLTMYTGCTRGDAIDVDGIDLLDLPESKQREIAIEVFTELLDLNNPSGMLRDLITTHHTECVDRGTCEQCGDWMMDYILEI